MKGKIKIITTLLILLLIITFLNTTVFAVSDLTILDNTTTEYLGQTFKMNWDNSLAVVGSNLYCIQHHASLKTPEVTFLLDKDVEINGKEARSEERRVGKEC